MFQHSLCEWKKTALPLVACVALAAAMARAEQPCDRLTALKLPDTVITAASVVAAGPFTVPTIPRLPVQATLDLPAFCRVYGTIKPTSDSDIQFEVWMPLADWNGRFLQVGNAGFNGPILPLFLTRALKDQFAVAATNNGHQDLSVNWMIGHPEKVIDFAYRAVHLTSERAKDVVKAFYGKGQEHSYFNGCSEGGREALMVAQRYPEDFDGVIAGDSGHVWNHLFFAGIWDIRAFSDDPASYIPPAKLEMVRQAVLDACDAMDGVKDGILTDPRRCHFDPAALLCKNGAGDGCLTQPQVDALKKVYAGPKNSRTGERINFGLEPGIETSMPSVAPGTSRATGNNDLFFRGMGFEDPKWDAQSLNFDEHVAFIDKKLEFMNATNPDLTRFKRRGGKLIQYHGWSDPGVPPLTAVAYFESVMAKTGGEKRTTDFYRLFMAPGMAHCFGGPGPNSFGNLLAPQPLERNDESDIGMALVRWVEHGVAPAKIIAVKFKDDDPQKGVVMTRPLCPYPQVAAWTSKGDTNSAANFVCRAEGQEKKPADRAK